jgi:DNA-binding FrmR family transcriptional regulator
MKSDQTTKNKKLIAAKKAKSLIQKIESMIESDAYCIDIMQQNLAVIGLLKNLNKTLMTGHLDHCFRDALVSKNHHKQQQMIQEIITVTDLNR